MFILGVCMRPRIAIVCHRVRGAIARRLHPVKRSVGAVKNKIYGELADSRLKALGSAIKISYVGDLILLRDGVENAYDPSTGRYEFDDVFRYVKRYWQNDDLTVGVFEGPMAGSDYKWTTSDFYDCGEIELHLNFPDSFALAMRKAGMDFVTTANNHLLDQKESGAMRTLDVLDRVGLDHTGSYRNRGEREALKIVNVRGRRIAVLSYTYGSNFIPEDYFFDESTCTITKPVVSVNSPHLKENIALVEADFARAKAAHPDAIFVMPHMGGQFRHSPDATQLFWCEQFARLGADVILSSHPHAVQPIEWRKCCDRDVLIVHCPGNFVNTYSPYDGDCSIMAEVYLDETTAKPIAASCLPLYAYGEPGGNYVGMPLYDIATNVVLQRSMSREEFKRTKAVQKIATKVALGEEIGLENAEERYYLFPGQKFERTPIAPMPLVRFGDSKLLALMRESDSICFVGDSVTEGTMNGGVGWFEPIAANFKDRKIIRFALGSMTSKWFASKRLEIASKAADLYVLAYGCNDIRYRNADVCAMTAQEYVEQVNILTTELLSVRPTAKIVCIAPWISLNHDKNWKGLVSEKMELYAVYSDALKMFCNQKGLVYIDPNPFILDNLQKEKSGGGCMCDYIHPGSARGVYLYSEACLRVR